MKRFGHVICSVFILIIACPAWATNSKGLVLVSDNGVTNVISISSKHKVKVFIKSVQIKGRMPYVAEDDLTRNLTPTVIESIKIEVDGKLLEVPISAFADLVDPREVKINIGSKRHVLCIWGADAADSYLVKIYFDSKAVNRRTLSSTIPPQVITEETRYIESVLTGE